MYDKKEYLKSYRVKNKQKIKKQRRKKYQEDKFNIDKRNSIWKEKNKEKVKNYQKFYRQENKQKLSEQSKKYREENKNLYIDYKKRWYQDNKVIQRDKTLKYKFGLTLNDYNTKLQEQNYCCKICKKHQSNFIKSLHVDHCHKTSMIRGLLCCDCNLGIGNIKESTETLKNCILYLKKESITIPNDIKIKYSSIKEIGKNSDLKKLYNITLYQYREILKNQNESCSICKIHSSNFKRSLAVDHCHKTMIVRGLLCSPCNLILGRFDESADIFESAINYLESYKNIANLD